MNSTHQDLPPTPYYQDADIVIYHGDAREILPRLADYHTIITDPVWPNALPQLQGSEAPWALLADVLSHSTALRLAIHLGGNSDPRFLAGVPPHYPFFRSVWLSYTFPSYRGRLLYTADVA